MRAFGLIAVSIALLSAPMSAAADEPTSQPTSMPSTDASAIVGSWQMTDGDYTSTFAFSADGTVNIEHAFQDQVGFSWGEYTYVVGAGVHTLTITLTGDDGVPLSPDAYVVTFDDTTMTMTNMDGGETTYTRVDP